MGSHKEQLMSMDFCCSCSHCSTRMKAVKYRGGTRLTPEMAVYECTLCGKRKIVVYKPETVLMSTLQPATAYRPPAQVAA